ncbi:MAG: hypothetical protein JWP61_2125 [Friedmanniella sp.]|nr:hypothetical protein [Friedmanniella sp.]
MLVDIRVLAVDTGRVFWRLLPQLLTLYLAGWLGSELARQVAVGLGRLSAWAALAAFSFSFLFTLVAAVLILRLCGRELGIWAMLPATETVADGRDTSLTQLLAVTLLPFLGLYAAFGQVQTAASGLANEQIYRGSVFDEGTVLRVVRGMAVLHPWRLLGILVGSYLLRRLVEALHERTGWRPLGIIGALVESFFLLVGIFGGATVLHRVTDWLEERAFVGWLAALRHRVDGVLALIHDQLPTVVDRLAAFLAGEAGPALWSAVSQPVVWLAVAALVFGTQVLSLADLWRMGRPLTARVTGASRFARHRDKLALRRPAAPPPGVVRTATELKDAFLGDIDDKYLPALHSLRLVLRAGGGFLGAYVLLYGALTILRNYLDRLLHGLIGGREVDFWFVAGPFLDLARAVPLELLRLCLLAVAFRRCLELFRHRAADKAPATVWGLA